MDSTAGRVRERLGLIYEWYRGMIDERSGRLVYLYDPARGTAVTDGSPIRNIASVWDAEILGNFLERRVLRPFMERTLEYYSAWLVARDGYLILDPKRLGEPSGIAHSAFMILALLHSGLAGRKEKIAALADGIVAQQRKRDGSYKIYFGPEGDDGLDLYPAEAMLALLQTYHLLPQKRYRESAERGFLHYKERYYEKGRVRPDALVFFANWQAQCGRLLYELAEREGVKGMVKDYLFRLYDRILESGFPEGVEKNLARQASVEVACALEGLNDTYAIASRESDDRLKRYNEEICTFLSYLLALQCTEHCHPRERGGFGYSFAARTQRIDVTGHVVNGLIKTLDNGIECPRTQPREGGGETAVV